MRIYGALGTVLLSLSLVGCATCVSDFKPKENSGKIVAYGDCSDGAVEVDLDNSDVMVSMSAGNSIKEMIINIKITVTDGHLNIDNIRFYLERLKVLGIEGEYQARVIHSHSYQESKSTPVVLSQAIKITSKSQVDHAEITFLPGAIHAGDRLSKETHLSFVRSTTYRPVHDAVARSFIQALF